ncbi:MAG: selenocysteine-specific translation elongation factor, partial [Verrucomicrobiota bacterium]
MTNRRHYILATAGHVDHGKSSLIKKLTGIDPDRLPKEKARGLTIDLGFASLELEASNGDMMKVGIVDVPGHADFIKNMVAGVGAVNLAMLVVAADDGWMPQTEEHIQILEYLGVRELIVVLSKIDLFDDLDLAIAEIQEHLEGTFWPQATIIPTSTKTGEGIDSLQKALSSKFESLPVPEDVGKVRLPVDRVFSVKGAGSVVTGTLAYGCIRKGSQLVVQPSGIPVNVREIQAHNATQEVAFPGSRTALNLGGLSRGKGGLSRGSIVSSTNINVSSLRIHVTLHFSVREESRRWAVKMIKNGQELIFHFGCGNHHARIFLLADSLHRLDEPCLAELRFRDPQSCWVEDRFILRDLSGTHTLVGGVVLDPAPLKNSFRKAHQIEYLQKRAETIGQLDFLILTLVKRDKALKVEGLLTASPYSEQKIMSVLEGLIYKQRIVESGPWIFDADWWEQISEWALECVLTFHQKNPEKSGMPLTLFRKQLETHVPNSALFECIEISMERIGIKRMDNSIRHENHAATLPEKYIER